MLTAEPGRPPLKLPYLKEIVGKLEEIYPREESPSPQKIADALQKAGIRLPHRRPRAARGFPPDLDWYPNRCVEPRFGAQLYSLRRAWRLAMSVQKRQRNVIPWKQLISMSNIRHRKSKAHQPITTLTIGAEFEMIDGQQRISVLRKSLKSSLSRKQSRKRARPPSASKTT
jgi:hypothetical protein